MKNHPNDIFAETPTKPRKGIGEPPFCINCGKFKHEPMIYTCLGNKIAHCKDCLLKKDPESELFPICPKNKGMLVKRAIEILNAYVYKDKQGQLVLF